ncbi:TolC family protein [Maribacter sp. HTCC2170]|uniref:TolC family protein n=1 Tax=Maribacter sp. (strain HTCC2170 / KCCM 42371) TaxID=313603 RepID=UPI00006B47A5|nr:TolC family protein [Maribacter sp. HTCC2170]EAR01712.1 putative outer membrane protein TolC [Maribacter sp. HTCC2170]
MRRILFLGFLIVNICTYGQSKKIQLTEAIKIAQKKSPEYKRALNTHQRSYWRYRNHIADFLPQVSLDATLPEYSNSATRILNDEGQYIFVKQNQSAIETSLRIQQRVPFTGGAFFINTKLDRVNRLGVDKSTNYSFVPFSINYFQNSLFYNPYKWDRKIEPLRYEESQRNIIERMEDISLSTCQLYFGLLKAQVSLDIAKKNLSNQDTLLQITEGRFKIGKVAENELLQIELSHLNSKNNVTTNTVLLKRTSQDLARFLELETESIELAIPEKLEDFVVSFEKAMEEAEKNRKSVIEFRRRRLEAEQELARVKGSNRLEINVRGNFGLNRRAGDYNDLFQDYDQQQSVSVSVGIPIFDWGVSKSRRKIAEADLSLVENDIDQEQQEFEQEIYLHTLNWSSQRDFLATAEKAQEIALKRYEITKERYILGKITITDLNLAQQEKDKAVLEYLKSLEEFWANYYILRKLTLYDFLEDEKLKIADIVFD